MESFIKEPLVKFDYTLILKTSTISLPKFFCNGNTKDNFKTQNFFISFRRKIRTQKPSYVSKVVAPTE